MTATSADVVLSSRRDHVVTWTINLPDARNPISGNDVIDRLVELVEEANVDVDTRVVILTGAAARSPPEETSRTWRIVPGCSAAPRT